MSTTQYTDKEIGLLYHALFLATMALEEWHDEETLPYVKSVMAGLHPPEPEPKKMTIPTKLLMQCFATALYDRDSLMSITQNTVRDLVTLLNEQVAKNNLLAEDSKVLVAELKDLLTAQGGVA